MTWTMLNRWRSGSDHDVLWHFCPPHLTAAVIRDVRQKHGISQEPQVETLRSPLSIDYGGMIFLNEWYQASVFVLGDGKRSITVRLAQLPLLLGQLRRRLQEPRQAGARWPWVKLHSWPGRCVVLSVREARELVVQIEALDEGALERGAKLHRKQLRKAVEHVNVLM